MTLKHAIAAGLIVAAVIGLGVAAAFRLKPGEALPPGIDFSRATLPGTKELSERTIADFGRNQDGFVSYSYLDRAVPELIVPDEVFELRTENSYTNFIEVVKPGDTPIVKLETVFYAQPAYAQDADGTWKYLEYATTTEQAFRARGITLWQRVREAFVRTAYADTISPFSGAGDGFAESDDTTVTNNCGLNSIRWDTTHDNTTGTGAGYTQKIIGAYAGTDYEELPGATPDTCRVFIGRGFTPFDTSSLSAAAAISSASLTLYATSTIMDFDNDTLDYITVGTSTQATHTSIVTADYNDAIPPTTVAITNGSEIIDVGQRKDISSITSGTPYTFTFNATGIATIKKSGQTSFCSATAGITCIGIREGHDAEDTPIVYADLSIILNQVYFSSSEADGTSQDPYLTVTYTAPAGDILRFKLQSGRIKVNGGRLKLQSN
jgi:hypothetical protein